MTKRRLSVSIDEELLEAGRAAVHAGEAENLSAWVSQAIARQAEHDRRQRAMAEFIAEYEAEHGEITEDEIAEARRWARSRAIVVRPGDVA